MVILMILIVAAIGMPAVYEYLHQDKQVLNLEKFNQSIALLKQAGVNDYTKGEANDEAIVPVSLFKFNPNGLATKEWQRLGLTPRQIKGIKNYEAKGGKFYTKADVRKMYTLTAEDYKRLEPYITLPSSSHNGEGLMPTIELNKADSVTLTHVHGIGPSFAARIVRYRKRLGGFHSKLQLKEVFGMDDARYAQVSRSFKVNAKSLKKINVNTATFDDLKDFPYLSFKQMNAIVQYRKQHGDYESLKELENIAIMDSKVLRKIEPYLQL